jgi:hypothetical protein
LNTNAPLHIAARKSVLRLRPQSDRSTGTSFPVLIPTPSRLCAEPVFIGPHFPTFNIDIDIDIDDPEQPHGGTKPVTAQLTYLERLGQHDPMNLQQAVFLAEARQVHLTSLDE